MSLMERLRNIRSHGDQEGELAIFYDVVARHEDRFFTHEETGPKRLGSRSIPEF